MNSRIAKTLADVHPRMLRATGESDPQQVGKVVIGRAIERALERSGLTNKEAAYAMGYTDSGVIGRWVSGTETPQVAKLWTLGPVFRQEFVIALAQQADGVEVTTHVSIRRTA